MLQKIYSIYSDDLNDARLFIEAGKNHIACWCKKPGDNRLQAFEFFRCHDYSPEKLEEIIDNARLFSRLLTMPVTTTNFFWNTDETLCLPPGNDNEDFLNANFDLMFGDSANTKVFSEATGRCIVAWRIDYAQQHSAQQCFRGAAFTNQYVPLFKFLTEEKPVGFYIFFYPNYFTLLLFKENKLQLAQTRQYSTQEDVLFFVLNVCEQYGVEKNADIFCGGFIDERSRLYDTLYQYLEGLQLMQLDENAFATDKFKEFSSHYFMPYINYVV